jgi:F420-dependent oxidoreductase-like protein
MRVCLMIEGQEDVTWGDWLGVAQACEDSGIDALFRSDHYLSVIGRTDRGSLDAWATLSALAAVTRRIRLGTLVSPATFRHPSVLAKMVVTADHVSGGRVELGLGAGWLEPEHVAYGFPFPPTPARMEALAEQLEIVHRSWAEGPFTFAGKHFQVTGLDALPKPLQRPHPPLIVGGSGGPQSVRLAARWADEHNTVFTTAETCRQRRGRVEAAFEQAGRDPADVRFSLMTGCVIGEDPAAVRRRAEAVMERTGQTGDVDTWLVAQQDAGWVAGTVEQATDQLARLREAGVDGVMLQHLCHKDLDMVHLLGAEVRPSVA